MLSIIVAFDEVRGIGKDGWMPWDLPEDLKLFKERTLGHALVMGSTTFLGLPNPLKNRHTYVINEKVLEENENVTYVTDLADFLVKAQADEEEYFVCGGASIYRQALPFCAKMYISHVKGQYCSDTYFPEFLENEWEVVKEADYPDFTLKEYRRRTDNEDC